MREIDPLVWFGTREIAPTPKHFIKSATPVTSESLLWVIAKLKGRYSISDLLDDSSVIVFGNSFQTIFFEDPADAMMFELRWSGSK